MREKVKSALSQFHLSSKQKHLTQIELILLLGGLVLINLKYLWFAWTKYDRLLRQCFRSSRVAAVLVSLVMYLGQVYCSLTNCLNLISLKLVIPCRYLSLKSVRSVMTVNVNYYYYY